MAAAGAGRAHTRIPSIEVLRGLAALSVTWFHLTNGYEGNWVRDSGRYGWLGVEAFFVISGVVIPLSIRAGFPSFSIRDFPVYMARRLIRLEPPYLISVLLVIALWELSSRAPGFAGEPPSWTVPQVLSHIAYATPLTPWDWLQPVYWTLAYEFVFYIVVGLVFWVFGYRRFDLWASAVGFLLSTVWIGWIPPLALLFVVGIAVFRRIAMEERFLLTCLAFAGCAFVMYLRGYGLHAGVGVGVALVILATRDWALTHAAWQPLLWLGTCSYSLYLVHLPIGGRVVNLFGRYIPDTATAMFFLSFAGLTVSLLAAIAFWWLFERWAILLSRRAAPGAMKRAAISGIASTRSRLGLRGD
ncbi:acyltransferase family protein [Roseitranquillus sediminis]|uniref:acyltransferase family protein n=1 Tax=Roseitranquillus sediminis TaxID=2809051 RepID=UPI001D0C16E6|nr:acyltransferase [Roseitranquillus sediminis]MBM9594041.1 acyltransferase [Roseitranquillus sediminis]